MEKEKYNAGKPPFAAGGNHAGFPSPAQDYMNPCIDLNKELVSHPAATFYGRVAGNSMADAGVEKGDILVIDKSLEAKNGDMVVCFVDGEFILRNISFNEDGSIMLVPSDPSCPAIKVAAASDFTVWGVVTYIIKKVRHK